MLDLKTILFSASQLLTKTGNKTATIDAEVLLAFCLKTDRTFLHTHPETTPTKKQLALFRRLLRRRANGAPIAYLIGQKEFFGRNFLVNRHVLIPRPESELLIEEVLKLTTSYQLLATNLADIGTGSGCLAITLKKELPQLKVYAVDKSRAALTVAKTNAKKHQAKIIFKSGNLLSPLKNIRLDVLVANLPYLTTAEWRQEKSIQAEPRLALEAGPDGLKLFRQLFLQIKQKPNLPRFIFLEIGWQQAGALKKLVQKYLPTYQVKVKKDLAGLDRILILNKSLPRRRMVTLRV